MKHLKKGRKFGRKGNQRHALMKGLASSFFVRGKIITSEAKAKELRPFVEKMLTQLKRDTIADRRYAARFFSEGALRRLREQAQALAGRQGGYTRIIKLGSRKRDAARMAMLEMVE